MSDGIHRTATLSDDGVYRYNLQRRWSVKVRPMTWIMLNPSTADHEVDDPTIRRCIGFARQWGYGGINVVNLFALRATNPKELLTHHEPFGGTLNAFHIRSAMDHSDLVVAAWGASVPPNLHTHAVAEVFKAAAQAERKLMCLGKTNDGHPRHPLYQPSNRQLVVF